MGISHSWNGTILTITSDSGTSSADLKGDTGIRGPQGPAGISIGGSGSVDLTGYATETFVTDKIAEAQLSGGEVDLSNYVTKTDLDTSVDTALTEAKQSGEFDGKGIDKVDTEIAFDTNGNYTYKYTFNYTDGTKTEVTVKDGENGADGEDGENGNGFILYDDTTYSPNDEGWVNNAAFNNAYLIKIGDLALKSNGDVYLITDTNTINSRVEYLYSIKGADGEKGDKGDTGANGADGKTPVKGVDYWTSADKNEIINEVNSSINYISPLYGKKIVYDGDSIAESRNDNGGGYAAIISEETNSTYVNQAISGARLVTKGTGDFHSIVDNLENLPKDGDLYCFEGGINDYWTYGVLGEYDLTDFSGNYDKTTVCGALETIFNYALKEFTGKSICFVISHKIQNTAYTKNANENTFKEYRDAMVGICEKYSIPYYDAFTNSGLNGWNSIQNRTFLNGNTSGQADGTHPNEEGYKRYYVPQLIKLFENIMPLNVGEIIVETYTNILETVGYTADKRLSSGNGAMKDNSGTEVTGKIEVSANDVIYLKNVGMPHEGTGIFDNQVAFFGTNDVFIKVVSMDKNVNGAEYSIVSDGTNVTQFTIPSSIDGTIIGAMCICANFDETSIITINEPIE